MTSEKTEDKIHSSETKLSLLKNIFIIFPWLFIDSYNLSMEYIYVIVLRVTASKLASVFSSNMALQLWSLRPKKKAFIDQGFQE